MKIILLQDVKNLGKKGDVKEVANGYAQNFLLPKKMAEIATQTSVKKAESQKEAEKRLKEAEKKELKSLAEKLKGEKLVIKAKEKNGKLFGSISCKDIAEEIKKKDLNILADSIIIKQAIKKIGEHEIKIKLADGIEVKMMIEVKSAQ